MIPLIKRKGVDPNTKEDLYYPRWVRISTVNETHLAKRMARSSTFSVGEVSGMFADFPQMIVDELLNGNAVNIGGLGMFKLKVHGNTSKDKKNVGANLKFNVTFEPADDLVSRLNEEGEYRFVEVPNE